jgi:hypothetical protein
LDMYLAPSMEMQSPNGLATVMIPTFRRRVDGKKDFQ